MNGIDEEYETCPICGAIIVPGCECDICGGEDAAEAEQDMDEYEAAENEAKAELRIENENEAKRKGIW